MLSSQFRFHRWEHQGPILTVEHPARYLLTALSSPSVPESKSWPTAHSKYSNPQKPLGWWQVWLLYRMAEQGTSPPGSFTYLACKGLQLPVAVNTCYPGLGWPCPAQLLPSEVVALS